MIKTKIFFCVLLAATQVIFAQTKKDVKDTLSTRERSIVIISAYTAQGNMLKLQTALNDGLNAGLNISETKEILVQLYAYAGFPRSLNALDKLMAVLEERKKNGISDVAGKEPSSNTDSKNMLQTGTENQTKLTGRKISGGIYAFAPAIDQFLKAHLFGAIFSRNNLDWKTRELVTIAALASMEGVEPQLRSHYGVGMHNGLTPAQLSELVNIVETSVDKHRGNIARQVLQSVTEQKPYTAATQPGELIFAKGQKIENDHFNGASWLNQLIQSDSNNTIQVGSVTFEPGARTNWHYHPAGQILLVLDGLGYYQEQGSPGRILRKGDVVKCPVNIPHWHGAARDEKFIQLAITDAQKGSAVWLHAVTSEEYNSVK